MRLGSIAVIVVTAITPSVPPPVSAQTLGDVFRAVNVSVVVIRAKGRDVATEGGPIRFSEIGSGVLISADGKIMTAAHVVHAMDDVTVEFTGGEVVRARVIASEPAADLSLIRLERVPAGAVVARMANSDAVRIGDQIVIIGAPYGLSHSMTVGWISARWGPNTVYKQMPLAEFFQTDAVINQGNSGGPMFNMAGEVIGIVSHNISRSGGSEGLGFAVTMNTARKLLLEERSVWSGLEGRFLTNELADIFNLPPGALGYLVKTVAAGSFGEAVGLRGGSKVAAIDGDTIVVGGDIILSVQGIAVRNFASYEQIRRALIGLPAGASITVTVLRAGQVLDLQGRLPPPQ
jgi:serine protease Do